MKANALPLSAGGRLAQAAKAATVVAGLGLCGCEALAVGVLPLVLADDSSAGSHKCKGAFVAGGAILTAAHCISGVSELPLTELHDDWTLLIDGRRGLELPVVAYSFNELRLALNSGATLEIAGQSPCQVTPPLGTGFYSSDCEVAPGDSGSPALLHLPCATDYECEHGLPHTVIVGLVSGYHGRGSSGPAAIVSAEEFASTINQ